MDQTASAQGGLVASRWLLRAQGPASPLRSCPTPRLSCAPQMSYTAAIKVPEVTAPSSVSPTSPRVYQDQRPYRLHH